jgi:2-methylcitrate dehydratase PrpD
MLEGGLVRNVYAGLSNRNGLLALQLAQSGFSGERDGLTSLMGSIVSQHFDTAELMRGLGDEWHLMQNYFKLHSCCRFNHGTLDALDQIAAQAPLPPPEQIHTIAVVSYNHAAELDSQAPHNTLASFSWDAVRDPAVRALAGKVTVCEDPAMTLRLPQERPARVTISLTNGNTLEGEVGVNRGDDALPYSRAELRVKFLNLTARVWQAAHGEAVLQATLDMAGRNADLARWSALLAHPPMATASIPAP